MPDASPLIEKYCNIGIMVVGFPPIFVAISPRREANRVMLGENVE